MNAKQLEIAGRKIGLGQPPYIIAELSGNHNGDLTRALNLIDVAKQAGVDAIKLQTYTADTMTIDHDGPGFVIEGGLWHKRRLYELYAEAHTPWDWHQRLFDHAAKIGLTCFSTPFDASAVALLAGFNAPAYKIASFEIVDIPLIRFVAQTGKPVIISTGMATHDEIVDAVDAALEGGAASVALLHCVSDYPTTAEDANLVRISALATEHDCPIGLSDHSLGRDVAVASVALGACIIEKHFTLSRTDGGPDAAFSLEPDELADLVKGVHTAHAALGRIDYGPASTEQSNMIFRRSLYAVKDIEAGEVLTERNIRSIRPALGLSPKHLPEVLGRRAQRAISRGTPLSFELFD